MCVALPGTVLSVNGNHARVGFHGNEIDAQAGLVTVKPGDRVLVHAGCIIQTMREEQADEVEEMFRLIEDF
ncbi:MAG: HypC/HybG/HupF family hydrogenase formation chaperone [Lachnospiraceae bacterium]|nr:HypC/HybG/HupF family hydrogenase formation chaperone [Lachnospiraceae bacterium]